MTSKERGQYIHYMLDTLFVREKHILRMYFGIGDRKIGRGKYVNQRRTTLEEIGPDFESSPRKVRYHMNKGLGRIWSSVISGDKVFPYEGMEDMREKCKQLKEYVEGINPDLIHKELPYHYSKSLDEFMLCLIDGVENTIYR